MLARPAARAACEGSRKRTVPRRRRLRRNTPRRVTINPLAHAEPLPVLDYATNHGFLAISCWHGACFTRAMRKPTGARKLLIASVGVATINYVAACGGEAQTSGNLLAPPEGGSAHSGQGGASAGSSTVAGSGGLTSGNLVAPPPAGSGGVTSGNLVAPPPAGSGGSNATAGAGGKAGGAQGGSAGRGGAGPGGGAGFTSGNLLPPPVAGAGGKAGAGGSSGSAGDGGASSGSGGTTGGTAGQP